MSVELQQDTEN